MGKVIQFPGNRNSGEIHTSGDTDKFTSTVDTAKSAASEALLQKISGNKESEITFGHIFAKNILNELFGEFFTKRGKLLSVDNTQFIFQSANGYQYLFRGFTGAQLGKTQLKQILDTEGIDPRNILNISADKSKAKININFRNNESAEFDYTPEEYEFDPQIL